MNRQMWIIFIMMASLYTAKSQINDDFSEMSGPFSDFWLGNTEKYKVNDSAELQLDDVESGSALLFQKTSWYENMSWELYFKLDFSPSNSNGLEIFLWSDTSEINQGNGYLLRIGENGSMDAIQLLQMANGTRTEIASSSLGLVAIDPVIIRIKASINNGTFLLEVDDQGTVCFLPEIQVPLDLPEEGSEVFFGWSSIYTSSRATNFFFDDVYVGPLRVDLTPPRVTQTLVNQELLEVLFSEPMALSSLDNTNISLTPPVSDLAIEIQKQRIQLATSQGFDNGISYSLMLSDLEDLSGNTLDTLLEFVVPKEATVGDLLINEILFNPKASGADFVEFYNQTDDLISLKNVLLINNSNGDISPLTSIGEIPKNGYLVVTDDKNNILENYPNNDPSVVFEINIPRFNNDQGNVSLVIDNSIIDLFDYDENFHQQLIDDVDGISLERISQKKPTNDAANWTSALERFQYGTPGLVNSVSGEINLGTNSIELIEKIFSPNGDGQADEANIFFNLNSGGYVATVRVYNDSGHLIKILSQNEILPSSGTIVWNGTTESGDIAPIGLYIIHISMFNLEGSLIQKKITVGLGNQLN